MGCGGAGAGAGTRAGWRKVGRPLHRPAVAAVAAMAAGVAAIAVRAVRAIRAVRAAVATEKVVFGSVALAAAAVATKPISKVAKEDVSQQQQQRVNT